MRAFSTFLHFLVLVSLLAEITGDSENVTDNKIASQLLLENNFAKAQNETTTITGNEGNRSNVTELKTGGHQNNHVATSITKENDKVNTNFSRETERRSRDTMNIVTENGIQCLSCYGNGLTVKDDACYKGTDRKTKKCDDLEQCFTELHPQYIKRGCMLPSSINRTFVCKCHLCNDKPSDDLTYYEYSTISDWEFDNKRLQMPILGMELLCKICTTNGVNASSDSKCMEGKYAGFDQCGANQLCYTNIDHQTEFISRGCIDQPVYNVLYFVCNEPKCNNDVYDNPKRAYPEIKFKTLPLVKKRSYSSANIQTIKSLCIIAIPIQYLI